MVSGYLDLESTQNNGPCPLLLYVAGYVLGTMEVRVGTVIDCLNNELHWSPQVSRSLLTSGWIWSQEVGT